MMNEERLDKDAKWLARDSIFSYEDCKAALVWAGGDCLKAAKALLQLISDTRWR